MKKKKDNGLRGVLLLAVATIAVGGASIALSNREHAGSTTLDITGANEKIKEARQNEDGTYTVTVSETGFAGEMVMEATYSADGQTLVSYDIISHNETPEYGGKADEKETRDKLAGIKLPVTMVGLDISQILGIKQEAASGAEQVELKDGIYTAQSEPDDKGNYGYVTVTVENGKIVSAVWDEIMDGGVSKAELAANGQYVMVEGNPTWKDQAESLGAYVVENQTVSGIANENGYTDAVSGVSINVDGFVNLANQAISRASESGEIPGAVAAPAIDATNVDVVSGATVSSKAVIRAINEGFVYLRDCVLNK